MYNISSIDQEKRGDWSSSLYNIDHKLAASGVKIDDFPFWIEDPPYWLHPILF